MNKRSRYHIIRLESKKGEILRFTRVLPKHLKICTAVKITCVDYLRNIRGENRIGILALELNGKKKVQNFAVDYSEISSPEFQDVSIVMDSPVILGYYINQFEENHRIAIYLRFENE